MTCPNCGHEQNEGKFCEACGQPISVSEETTQTDQTNTIPAEKTQDETSFTHASSQATEQQAHQSDKTSSQAPNPLKLYWNYCLSLLKNPTEAFRLNENHFGYGLINIGLFALLFSLSIYALASSFAKKFNEFGGMFDTVSSIPFSSEIRLFFAIILVLAISFVSALIVIKLAKIQDTFQTIVAQFGGLLVPFVFILVIGLIGGISESIMITLLPLVIALLFTMNYVPVLLTYEKLATLKHHHRIYLSFATVLIIIVLIYMLSDIWLENQFQNIRSLLNQQLY